ncbi:septation protein IspZ, partial [Bacteriovoracaceae bacterium]|nr:septation protein IspZ [Bacteriovoracaceae bacterium]
MSKLNSKNFFMISFLPAIAYWYLEENYPLRIAIAGGLALAVLEMILEKIFTKHVHGISKFNFYLILVLGGLSLIGDEGIWFKLQPSFTGVGIGLFIFFKLKFGEGLLQEMAKSLDKPIPPGGFFKTIETHMGLLFFFYGLFMAYVAINLTTGQWLFYKTAG